MNCNNIKFKFKDKGHFFYYELPRAMTPKEVSMVAYGHESIAPLVIKHDNGCKNQFQKGDLIKIRRRPLNGEETNQLLSEINYATSLRLSKAIFTYNEVRFKDYKKKYQKSLFIKNSIVGVMFLASAYILFKFVV